MDRLKCPEFLRSIALYKTGLSLQKVTFMTGLSDKVFLSYCDDAEKMYPVSFKFIQYLFINRTVKGLAKLSHCKFSTIVKNLQKFGMTYSEVIARGFVYNNPDFEQYVIDRSHRVSISTICKKYGITSGIHVYVNKIYMDEYLPDHKSSYDNTASVNQYGTICALYGANWSLRDIADECHCTTSSVKSVVTQYYKDYVSGNFEDMLFVSNLKQVVNV